MATATSLQQSLTTKACLEDPDRRNYIFAYNASEAKLNKSDNAPTSISHTHMSLTYFRSEIDRGVLNKNYDRILRIYTQAKSDLEAYHSLKDRDIAIRNMQDMKGKLVRPTIADENPLLPEELSILNEAICEAEVVRDICYKIMTKGPGIPD